MSTQAPVQPSADAAPAPETVIRKKPSAWMKFWKNYALAILFALIMIGIWEGYVRAFHVPKYLLPAPSGVVVALKTDWVTILWPATWVSLREVLIGFAIAAVAGVGLAILLHMFGPLRRAVYPLLIGSQTIPIVVLAPILVIILGYGILPKLVIVALICFFPITVNTLDGLRSVDPEATKMMRTLDASRSQILWRLEAPTALPYAFSGAKIAVAVAVIGAVFGEWAGSNSGLGHLMLQDNAQLETARLFAAVAVLSVIAVALFGLLALAERHIVTWR